MKTAAAFLLYTVGTITACGHPVSPVTVAAARPAGEALFIRDVTLVSPERASPLPHASILVRDGLVVRVDEGPSSPPAGTAILEGAGRFLVPGLIDGHVHLAEIPGVTRDQAATLPGVAEAYFRQLPRSYLYFGFTTVVDLSVVEPDRIAALRRAPLGPTILDCGGGLAMANGYPMVYAPPELRWKAFPNFLYDPAQASAIPASFAPADHSPQADVARVADGGGVCVKTFYEPGFGGLSKLPLPTVALEKDVVSESHRRHLPVLLHANSLTAHRFAVASGVDVSAHGLWNWEKAGTDVGPDGLPETVRAVLDAEIAAGIGVEPTSRVISGLEDLFVPEFLDDPQLANVLPAELLAWYRSPEGGWFARATTKDFDGMPPERVRQRFHEIGEQGRAAARYFAAHGGHVFFGSDTPSAPTYANPPGYNGHLEMRELERAGLSPRAILTAATLSNAKLFGVAGSRGTIEPGKRADLLLLASDPLASVSAFDAIEVVVIGGKVVKRGDLTGR